MRMRFGHLPALVGASLVLGCAVRPRGDAVVATALEASATVPSGAAGDLVRALASDDFLTRNRAADELVALGESALPALGAAGDLRVAAHGRIPVSTTRPVVAAILAAVPEERLVHVHLASDAAVVRRGAAEEVGRRELWAGVPDLIERLADGDASVRVASIGALRRITNRFYDLDASACGPTATVALQQAREWWNREGRLAAKEPAKGSG